MGACYVWRSQNTPERRVALWPLTEFEMGRLGVKGLRNVEEEDQITGNEWQIEVAEGLSLGKGVFEG